MHVDALMSIVLVLLLAREQLYVPERCSRHALSE